MQILLVEDDIDLAENIIDYLEDAGYTMDYAMNGESALNFLQSGHYDAVILDIGLPGIDGFTVCERIRTELKLNISIIMLTARTHLDDKLAGFQAGTDDYLPKPFELPELKVRIDAIARRGHPPVDEIIQVGGDLEYDVRNGLLKRNGMDIPLPPVCSQIVKELMQKYPNIVTRNELEYAIWGDVPPDTDTLKVHWHTLRQFADKPFDTHSFITIRGKGYMVRGTEG